MTLLEINYQVANDQEINITSKTLVSVNGKPINRVNSFVYMGSVIGEQGGKS